MMEGKTMLVWLLLAAGTLLPFEGLCGELSDGSGLSCMEDWLIYTIPKNQIGDAAPKLTVLDKDGLMQPLTKDLSCGLNLTEQADGSLKIVALYDGCYVGQKNNSYVMVLVISYKDDYGAWKDPEQKELQCQIRPAMDAPSSSQCADVDRQERLVCGGALITSDQCQSQGCCYDSSDRVNPCYYGNKVTVRCTSDGMFSVAVSKYTTVPALTLASVKLTRATDQSCGPLATTGSFILFQFPVSACGTISKTQDNLLVYENEVMAKRAVQTWQGSSITRDSTFRLTVRCSVYSGAHLPLRVDVLTVAPPHGVTSQGPLNLELRIAKGIQYVDYYTDGEYPIVKLLRDPVFVEVRILQREDPQLVLLLQQCWATPTSDPFNPTQWPLLLDGCPFTGDNYLTLIAPDSTSTTQEFLSYRVRFIVNTFTFVNVVSQPLHGQVYFHCAASVCVPSATQACSNLCTSAPRSKKHVSRHPDMNLVSSHGPIDFNIAVDKLESMSVSKNAAPVDLAWIGIASVLGVICVAVIAVGFWGFVVRRRENVTLQNL
uniref:Zona pellucida sperm-binding protein 4 n=1 Tax=Leptobrachium leishanense TaxID=445787 RepID=A0A8C5LKD0_9ANUR